jgi:hypothetical protein
MGPSSTSVGGAEPRLAAPNPGLRRSPPGYRQARAKAHRLGRPASVVALGIAALAARTARAADVEVSADSAMQMYDVVSPWGNVVLLRRRVTQTVGLGVYNLQGAYRPGEADYRVVLRMRLDWDFGVNAGLRPPEGGGETIYNTATGPGVRYVPGLQSAPVDLMYGYVEGRNIGGGLFGFRLGRQYMNDVLGWWSFDGGLARVTTPFYVQVEVFGGLEQRGGLPLSTSRFEAQGVWRGSHAAFGAGPRQPTVGDYPSYLYAQPAPALGFAIESAGPSFLHARLAFRRVYNTGTVVTEQFPDATGAFKTITGTRISQDKIGASLEATKADLGTIRAQASYDLYNQLVSTVRGGIEVYAGKRVTVGADVDYFVPTFDADSIWNWFTHGPLTTITSRVAIRATRRLDLAATGGARLWTTEGDPATFGAAQCRYYGFSPDCVGRVSFDPNAPGATTTTASRDPDNRKATTTADALGDLSARYRFGSGHVALRGMIQAGKSGSREGGELGAEKLLDGGRYTTGARVSVYGWSDPTRPDRDAVSFGYVLAGGFRPKSFASFRLEWEHDTNRLVGQRYRLIGLLQLELVR